MSLKIDLARVRKNKIAILAAAEFIVEKPEHFDFMKGRVPSSQRESGCLLAWIGYFAGIPAGTEFTCVAEEIGLPDEVGTAAGERFSEWVTYRPDLMAQWAREVVEFAEE